MIKYLQKYYWLVFFFLNAGKKLEFHLSLISFSESNLKSERMHRFAAVRWLLAGYKANIGEAIFLIIFLSEAENVNHL